MTPTVLKGANPKWPEQVMDSSFESWTVRSLTGLDTSLLQPPGPAGPWPWPPGTKKELQGFEPLFKRVFNIPWTLQRQECSCYFSF